MDVRNTNGSMVNMSKRMYKQGKKIYSMADFENSKSMFYIVYFGNKRCTKHRSFLISWQYRILSNFITNGLVYEADKENKGGQNEIRNLHND